MVAVAAGGIAAGCSIDRIEWESTGYVVDAVTHTLREEHHVRNPVVECIKREVGGSLWECRAHAERAAFTCKVHVGIREQIRSIHCKEEEAPQHETAG